MALNSVTPPASSVTATMTKRYRHRMAKYGERSTSSPARGGVRGPAVSGSTSGVTADIRLERSLINLLERRIRDAPEAVKRRATWKLARCRAVVSRIFRRRRRLGRGLAGHVVLVPQLGIDKDGYRSGRVARDHHRLWTRERLGDANRREVLKR